MVDDVVICNMFFAYFHLESMVRDLIFVSLFTIDVYDWRCDVMNVFLNLTVDVYGQRSDPCSPTFSCRLWPDI